MIKPHCGFCSNDSAFSVVNVGGHPMHVCVQHRQDPQFVFAVPVLGVPLALTEVIWQELKHLCRIADFGNEWMVLTAVSYAAYKVNGGTLTQEGYREQTRAKAYLENLREEQSRPQMVTQAQPDVGPVRDATVVMPAVPESDGKK